MTDVSVIIPTWNREQTIVVAVQSALAQTLSPLEVLVCDDGSSDNSEALVRAIGDPRVKWISGPRGGRPAIPRNRGISVAQGEWLAFLDSDDGWLPEKLERQLAAVKSTGHLASCTDAWRIIPGSRSCERLLGGDNRILDFVSLLADNRVICSSVVLHRSLFAKIEGFPEGPELKAIEDYALWLRVLCLTQIDYVGMPLLGYTDDPAHSVRAEERSVWDQRAAIMKNLLAWAQRAQPPHAELVQYAARRELQIAHLQRFLPLAQRFDALSPSFQR